MTLIDIDILLEPDGNEKFNCVSRAEKDKKNLILLFTKETKTKPTTSFFLSLANQQ